MNKRVVADHIDFADSEFIIFEFKDSNNIVVNLLSWDEKNIEITFFNAVYFQFRLGSLGGQVFEIDNKDEIKFLGDSKEVLASKKLFYIEDIDDFPYIIVIADSISVVKRDELQDV